MRRNKNKDTSDVKPILRRIGIDRFDVKELRLHIIIPALKIQYLRDIVAICQRQGCRCLFVKIIDTKVEESFTKREIFKLNTPAVYFSVDELKANNNRQIDGLRIYIYKKDDKKNALLIHYDPWILSVRRTGDEMEPVFNELYLYLKNRRAKFRTILFKRPWRFILPLLILSMIATYQIENWESVNAFLKISLLNDTAGMFSDVSGVVSLLAGIISGSLSVLSRKGKVILYEKKEIPFLIKYKDWLAPIITGLAVTAATLMLSHYFKG